METLWNTGMKQFDPLIIPGKKPMTVFDTEEAEEFIGKEGFFTSNARDFTLVEYLTTKGTLLKVDEKRYAMPFKSDQGISYSYFLPLEFTDISGI